jgi:hypothetical protein
LPRSKCAAFAFKELIKLLSAYGLAEGSALIVGLPVSL